MPILIQIYLLFIFLCTIYMPPIYLVHTASPHIAGSEEHAIFKKKINYLIEILANENLKSFLFKKFLNSHFFIL